MSRVGVAVAVVAGGLALLGLPLVSAVGWSGTDGGTGLSGLSPSAAGALTDRVDAEVAAQIPGIPAPYLADFEASGTRFDVPWAVLAGIYKVECDFGQGPLRGCARGTENSAGAQGPGQFLAPTWRKGLAPHQIIPLAPPTTSNAAGYATDGDGDGVADPWDPADAVASTARLLAADGAASGNISGAIYAYNHDPAYVNEVLTLAAGYTRAATPGPATRGLIPSSASAGVAAVVQFAATQLGKPYQWGGAGPATWDCSGLVQAAYARAGVLLSHNAAAQYRATADDSVPVASTLEAGDLVFFGPSLAGIEHVGIVIGAGQMIDAPHTGAFVRVEPYRWSDLVAATRPL